MDSRSGLFFGPPDQHKSVQILQLNTELPSLRYHLDKLGGGEDQISGLSQKNLEE